METCNHDCFNCVFDDCKVNKMTKEERIEIQNRDFNYFDCGTLIKQKPNRSRLKYSK